MEMMTASIPQPIPRNWLKDDLNIDSWESLKPYYEDLLNRDLDSVATLEQWLLDYSELDSIMGEEVRWRYVRMTCDTENKEIKEAFQSFVKNIQPKLAPYEDKLNRKLVASEYCSQLDQSKHFIALRRVRSAIELFCEANIELSSKLTIATSKYGEIVGKMTIEVDGEVLTLQQAAAYLSKNDRAKREEVYKKIAARRAEDRDQLDTLLNELTVIRHQMALNAGFENYRDYKFKALGRFDYTPEDCFAFHNAVAREIVPILNELDTIRKQDLNVQQLRPWDTEVDPSGKAPLKPFNGQKDLVEKTIKCMGNLHPYFGKTVEIMRDMDRLDLESRQGKRPGGYNMGMPATGVPFVFMNAANSVKDLRTMVHEGGHAVHSLLMHDLELSSFKRLPSEIAELAAMSMELLTMDNWDAFFDKEEDVKRAKLWELEKVLRTLPWVATVDKFQHWMYLNPKHTVEERTAAWLEIHKEFASSIVNWDGLEDAEATLWQKQLHIYEVPFYYIEYGMAQLGAVAIWKRYNENPTQAVQGYIDALKLGYTRSIGETYEKAGIEFNFTQKYVGDLGGFIKDEIDALL